MHIYSQKYVNWSILKVVVEIGLGFGNSELLLRHPLKIAIVL
jgi:hypothetical protein